MIRDVMSLNYKQVAGSVLISFLGLFALIYIGRGGLIPALSIGLVLFTYAMTNLMGKNVVGANGVLMNLLPVPAKLNIGIKAFVSGSWVGVICSVPAFLMMKNGGFYIDEWLYNVEQSGTSTIFYRDLLYYDYAIKANPSAMDVAVGDLMDGGAGLLQVGIMSVLIPVILFLIGSYMGTAVLVCQLYLHPFVRKYPLFLVSIVAMVLSGAMGLGVIILLVNLIGMCNVSLFAGELFAVLYFGGMTWLFVNTAVKRLEKGYDV